MKLSDYIALFLAEKSVKYVFAISGGASLHLIHSVAETSGMMYICPQHEQAAAMAADGYSRVTGDIGVAIATSGPGATNLITGICCAYYDSVPTMYITGQVSTFRSKSITETRQLGFQETDTVGICRPITKYAVRIDDKKRIRYEMEKAYYLAKNGRPGPVLIDVPDNIQREDIDPNELESFVPNDDASNNRNELCSDIDQVIRLLGKAKRPVIVLGWGVRLAKAEEDAIKFVEKVGHPVLLTWATMDILPSNHELVVGGFGTHGTRYGNFTVQNADLILSIGSRLDTHVVGSPFSDFARDAKKIVVDIDLSELDKFAKFGMKVDLPIHVDAKIFLKEINAKLGNFKKQDISDWLAKVRIWKEKYPICPIEYYNQKDVNPYVFVKCLSREAQDGDVIFVDTGCSLAWMMQAFEFKTGQRLFHDFNNTAMGYALPASIGGAFALEKKSVICVAGDGSFQMSIHELATVIRHKLPIKIFLINNNGYSMIQQTQDQWLNSKYYASTVEGGLAFPDFTKVAEAYGFKTIVVSSNKELRNKIAEALNFDGPVFCNVVINSSHRVVPQVKFGRPIEDSEPFLDRKEFFENMIVEPIRSSREKGE